MRFKILSIIGVLLILACQNSIVSFGENASNQKTAVQREDSPVVTTDETEIWTPTGIEDCMGKVDVGEPFKFETEVNPFYVRSNLDGNNLVDFAILIKGDTSRKRGVVICKDSKDPFVFGELSKPKKALSSFDNDNFVTNQWEVSTKEYTSIQTDPLGRTVSPGAKGESISFVFEGGNGVNIYWDGKTFRIGE